MTKHRGFPQTILTSLEDVIRRLGGPKAVADLTGVSRSSVWNWRQAGRFPPAHYRLIKEELALHGCGVELDVFAFSPADCAA